MLGTNLVNKSVPKMFQNQNYIIQGGKLVTKLIKISYKIDEFVTYIGVYTNRRFQ